MTFFLSVNFTAAQLTYQSYLVQFIMAKCSPAWDYLTFLVMIRLPFVNCATDLLPVVGKKKRYTTTNTVKHLETCNRD